MKRTMSEPGDHMNAEDVAAPLATVAMAISVALRGQGGRSTEQWLQAIGGEIGRTVTSLGVLPGSPTPGMLALQHVLGMIHASDPRRRRAEAEQAREPDSPASVTKTICEVATRRWPKQTAKHLAKHAGVQVRSAEYWLSEGAGVSSQSLVALLRSDLGGELLHALMGDAQRAWWSSFQQAEENARIRQKLDELRAEIDEAKRNLI